MFVVYVALNYFCTVVAKERTAGLVVLPPLVLGYDDLYEDPKGQKELNDNENRSRLDYYGVVEMDSDEHPSTHDDHSGAVEKGPKSNEEKSLKSNEEKGPKSNEEKGPKSNEDKDHPHKDQNTKNNCDKKFHEVEIVGKLIIPQQAFGCSDASHKEKKTSNNRRRNHIQNNNVPF